MKLFNVMVVYPLSERFWFRVLIYFEQFYSYGNCTANRFYMSGILVLNELTKVQRLANMYYDSKSYQLVGFYCDKRRPDQNP